MVEEEKKDNDKPVIQQRKKGVNWTLIVLIAVMGGAFIFAYTQKFFDSTPGTVGVLITILTGILIAVMYLRPVHNIQLTDEYAKDPFFYYNFLKDYYTLSKYPRMNMNLTWTGKIIYYPIVQPSMVFLELYDKLNQKPYVGVIRVMNGTQQVRGLIPSTWDDFMRNKMFRYKMVGMFPGDGGKITVIGRGGKTYNIPGEYMDSMRDWEL